jgi:drug/metabolite transporter (DMT)-like permease
MKYLIVLGLCALATLKVTTQGVFAKKKVKTLADATLFNGLIFFFAALIFSVQAFGAPIEVWLYGTVFGVLCVVFQITYTKALAQGNVSLSVLLVNLGTVFPILVSFFVFDEELSVMRVIGISLTLATFFIVTDMKKCRLRGVLPAFFAMIANGALGITQKLFGESQLSAWRAAFVSRAYIVASATSLVVYLVIMRFGKGISIAKNPSILAYSAATGIILALFQFFNTYAVSTVDGTFLFPAYSGGCIVLSTVTGVLLFKDRLSARQTIGVTFGILALIFMNF